MSAVQQDKPSSGVPIRKVLAAPETSIAQTVRAAKQRSPVAVAKMMQKQKLSNQIKSESGVLIMMLGTPRKNLQKGCTKCTGLLPFLSTRVLHIHIITQYTSTYALPKPTEPRFVFKLAQSPFTLEQLLPLNGSVGV